MNVCDSRVGLTDSIKSEREFLPVLLFLHFCSTMQHFKPIKQDGPNTGKKVLDLDTQRFSLYGKFV